MNTRGSVLRSNRTSRRMRATGSVFDALNLCFRGTQKGTSSLVALCSKSIAKSSPSSFQIACTYPDTDPLYLAGRKRERGKGEKREIKESGFCLASDRRRLRLRFSFAKMWTYMNTVKNGLVLDIKIYSRQDYSLFQKQTHSKSKSGSRNTVDFRSLT